MIRMPQGLPGQGRHMQAAEDDLRPRRAVAIRQPVGVPDSCRKARNGDRIEVRGQFAFHIARHLQVPEIDIVRRQSGERQQSQAGKRGDEAVALDKAWQGKPQSRHLRVVGPNAADRNQAESHAAGHPAITARAETRMLRTGMKNRWRKALRQAVRKQRNGMVTAPATRV
jgi:hypothetical protein